MNTRTLAGAAALLLLIGGVVAAGLYFVGGGQAEVDARSPDVGSDEPPDDGTDAAGAAHDRPKPPDVDLDPDIAPLPPPAVREGTVAKRKPGAPWITVGDADDGAGWDEGLAKVDWDALGATTADVIPVMADIANTLLRRDAAGDTTWRRYDTAYGEIMAVDDALRVHLRDPEAPQFRAMIHPATASNWIAATLAARRRGLTEPQLAALTTVARAATAEDAEARSKPPEITLELARSLPLSARLADFYRKAEAVLDAEQRRLLHSDVVRDRRRLDLFTAANAWFDDVHPVVFTAREDAIDVYAWRALQIVAADPRSSRRLEERVRERVEGLPESFFESTPDMVDLHGYPRYGRLTVNAALMLDVFVDLATQLSPEGAAAIPRRAVTTPLILMKDPDAP